MILQGNSIRIPLKDESVHACITSPPYFGLRDYSLKPTIWGGRSGCQHEWQTGKITNGGGGERDYGSHDGGVGRGPSPKLPDYATCSLCGAFYGCFGLEPTIAMHVQNVVLVCREIKRVLRKDGVLFINYGDSYSTSRNGRSAADTKAVGKDDRTFRDKPFSVTELPAKNLCLIPFRVALALQDDGWIVRSDIIWEKPNSMPESVTDRPSKSHEYIFMLVKSARYFYDAEAVRVSYAESSLSDPRDNGSGSRRERGYVGSASNGGTNLGGNRHNGRNLRTVWTIPTESFSGAHYATFPRKLVEPMILAATSSRGVCPKCAAPWQRVKEPTPEYATVKASMLGETHRQRESEAEMGKQAGWGKDKARVTAAHITTGWRPTCKCIQKRAPNFGMKGSELLELADEVTRELAPIPAIILDPFTGSGTVGAVCRELGRRFIGIDLSARYLAENALPRSEKKMSLKALGQLPMFAKLDEAA